jgi:hypothetical protein
MDHRAGLEDVEKKKLLTLPRSDPSVVQPVVSSCTDYAIPAPRNANIILIMWCESLQKIVSKSETQN